MSLLLSKQSEITENYRPNFPDAALKNRLPPCLVAVAYRPKPRAKRIVLHSSG